MTAIVWIRRSMRMHDNTALVEASKNHEEVIPVYVIDDDYFERAEIGYPRVKFWKDSLVELKEKLEEDGNDLIVRKGRPVEQLKALIEETRADKIYFNRDYSPYSKERDEAVKELDIAVETFKDIVMFEKEEILTNSGGPYKVYSYYRDKWFEKDKRKPRAPEGFKTPEIESDEIPSLEQLGFEEGMDVWDGGRSQGLERLEAFKQNIHDYADRRDYPAEDGTSKLSPYLKFGTISIREAYWAAEDAREGPEDEGVTEWQEQLAWRDFYFQVLWNFPRTVDEPFLEQYSSIDWGADESEWEALRAGKTGYPFVDAAMRQLKQTGWMHNRARMVVASFAAKDIFLDWKRLHDYFKRMFVDAELSSMIGGIQWAYSIGTDAQPYFRVFNPWTQGEDYDPNGEYIRKWVPELEGVPDEYIHRPYKMPEEVQEESGCVIGEDYPRPIIEHDERRKDAVELFEKAREN